MQINLGDFGYRGTTLQPVHTENPGTMAVPDAQKQAAQSTIQAQDTIQQGLREQSQAAANQAQAGVQMGNTLAGIGDNLVQYAQNLARQKAEIQLQDYQTFKQGVIQGISDKVQSGELDSTGIQKAYSDGMKGWKGDDIPDLTGSDSMRLQKGMTTVNRQGDQAVYSLYSRQLHAEGVNALQQTAAGYTQQMMQPGADVTAISGQIDELYNRSSTKALLGASWATQYQAAKKNLASTFYSSQIEANNDDNGALSTLKDDINNSAAKGILDLPTRTALFNTIDTKLARNDAKAIAAQNHADALATRREVAAVHADDQMQQRIARGEIPTEQDWQQFSQKTDGTSVAGQVPALQETMKDVQQVIRMPTGLAQQQLDNIKIQLDQQGGTKDQYRYYDTLQRTVDQRKADIKNNPQAVAAVDAGYAQATMKYTLLDAWTNAVRRAGQTAHALALGEWSQKPWDKLSESDRGMLNNAGITDADWQHVMAIPRQSLRGHPIHNIDDAASLGLNPDDTLRLQSRLMGFIRMGGDVVTSEHNLTAQTLMSAGGRTNALTKQVMLFKNSGAIQTAHMLDRLGRKSGNTKVGYIAATAALSAGFGYMALVAQALTNGQNPPPPNDWRTVGKAMAVAGGFAMVQDLITSMYDAASGDNSGHSSSAVPIFGDMATLGKIAFTSESDPGKAGYMAIRFARQQIAPLNYWYTKAAVDHLFFNDAAEALNPGYQKRLRKYADQKGQQYFYDPSGSGGVPFGFGEYTKPLGE